MRRPVRFFALCTSALLGCIRPPAQAQNTYQTAQVISVPFENSTTIPNGAQRWYRTTLRRGEPYQLQVSANLITSLYEIDAAGAPRTAPLFYWDGRTALDTYWVPVRDGEYYIRISNGEAATETNFAVFPAPARLLGHDVIAHPSRIVSVFFTTVTPDTWFGVMGLPDDGFVVTEDGVDVNPADAEIRVRNIDEVSYRLRTVLLIENSATAAPDLPAIKLAAGTLVDSLASFQEIAVVAYADSAVVVQEFTSDRAALRQAIDAVKSVDATDVNVYDALLNALDRAKETYALDGVVQGSVVMLGVNGDAASSATLEDVIAARGDRPIVIVTPGYALRPGVALQIAGPGYHIAFSPGDLPYLLAHAQSCLVQRSSAFRVLSYHSSAAGDESHELVIGLRDRHDEMPLAITFDAAPFSTASMDEPGPLSAVPVAVMPAYPNPSRGTVSLPLVLTRAMQVQMDVFDTTGRIVGTVDETMFGPGGNSLQWKPENVPPGLYLLRVTAGDRIIHRSVVIL